MEPFKIDIDNIDYNITPKEDESYLVETDNGDLFVITPDLDETGVRWNLVKGAADLDLVQSIGELIEEYEM